VTALAAIKPEAFDAEAEAAYLAETVKTEDPRVVIRAALDRFGSRFALVSSFGSESAVLLHLAAEVAPDLPVLFLDTGKLFGETKRYRDQLVARLGLTDVRTLTPDAEKLAESDPKGILWSQNPNGCCFVRKVVPLEKALSGFDAWASGRKRFQGGLRAALPHFEAGDGRVKVNPLAFWNKDNIKAYMAEHQLPEHPLVAEGFRSIGCMPCTDRVAEGEEDRAGRWRGQAKTECGIHLSFQENAALASYDSSGL